MSKFFFQLVIVIHVFACVWYCLACPLNVCSRQGNWVKHQGNSVLWLMEGIKGHFASLVPIRLAEAQILQVL